MTAGAEDAAWSLVRDGLQHLLADLGVGEVIELAAGHRFYLQVGRLADEICLLASGPATPDFEIGAVDEATGARLAELGFLPPAGEVPSWSYTVAVPTDPVNLELAAAIGVDALRQVEGVRGPSDLMWSSVGAGAGAITSASRLGIPPNPHQHR